MFYTGRCIIRVIPEEMSDALIAIHADFGHSTLDDQAAGAQEQTQALDRRQYRPKYVNIMLLLID